VLILGGDVGLHVGKAMWAIINGDEEKAWANVQALADKPLHERTLWIAQHYAKGHNAYEDDPIAKQQIVEANKKCTSCTKLAIKPLRSQTSIGHAATGATRLLMHFMKNLVSIRSKNTTPKAPPATKALLP
jgi:hypothetical protein